MEVDGVGSISVSGGEATFHLSATHGKKNKIVGSFSYSDPAANLSLSASKLTSLSFNGNQAQFTGKAKLGKHKVTFTVDVTDNGSPGTNDTFSISISNGYSAGGNLRSGNINIHN
jgi:hypothetical protein